MLKLILHTLLICSALLLSGCQSLTKTSNKVKDLTGFGEKKLPEVNQKSILDVSKTTLAQIEKITLSMPVGQWVYIENDLHAIYSLQNKSADGTMLLLRLNCKNPAQKSGFMLRKVEGQEILNAYNEQAGPIQFLLDNQNFGNPFQLSHQQKMAAFKTTLQKAKVIKIFNAGKLYTFQNGHAELLNRPVSCTQ